MTYPDNFEQQIGFTSIREMLKSLCISVMGKEMADNAVYSNDISEIRKKLQQVADFLSLLENELPFPVKDYNDLREDFKVLSIEGTVISQESLFAMKPTLSALSLIISFLHSKNGEKVPHLQALADGIDIDRRLYDETLRIIDDKGEIPDSASPELAEIRRDIRRRQSSIDKKLRLILNNAKTEGWTDSGAEITIRDGRPVIPVRASDKKALKGFIHDESATGQTFYIEPAEIFDTNNEIRKLEFAEKREINKILSTFTKTLRPEIPNLIKAWNLLGEIDFIAAKTLLYNNLNCIIPETDDKPLFKWKQARHPLLEQKLKSQNKEIEPLDLNLDKQNHILVISGPNAGGKSVCLKTAGLVQYMFQCGLPVPMKEGSVCGIFSSFFLDIGDQQSLENDLSTYSSHLLNMKKLLENCDENTLFLIDEFGSGTEPQLGGAIAEATLIELNKKGSFGLVTTHYANLKLLADNHDGIINGAMLFDTRFLKPLYMLMTGKPGSSFAFEIAKKTGFPQDILKAAAEIGGKNHLDFEHQLQQLDIEKKEIRKKEYELKVADDLLNEVVTKYKKLLDDIEKRKNQLLKDANTEARALIDKANAKIEKTIKEIREAQAEKEKTKELRHELNKMKTQLEEDAQTSAAKLKTDEPQTEIKLKAGDMVCINELEIVGEVTRINDADVYIRFGTANLRTTADKVRKISRTQAKKAADNHAYLKKNIMHDLEEKVSRFNITLDIRGQRCEEAVTSVEKYLDEATLLSVKDVSILHGKGNGVLRTVIREYLSHHKEVSSFCDANIETGGTGITRVKLK